jgi:hypothetical protein
MFDVLAAAYRSPRPYVAPVIVPMEQQYPAVFWVLANWWIIPIVLVVVFVLGVALLTVGVSLPSIKRWLVAHF